MTQNSAKHRFGIIGAAGYIAPRHMDAIRKIDGDVLAAMDPSDSVGIIDRHFPKARFFVNFERFSEHVHHERLAGRKIDYMTICSPNYLHKSHISYALRAECDAICEKPLVLQPGDLEDLAEVERVTGRKINTILQLRLHPAIIELRDKIASDTSGKIFDVDLTYITSRGNWYYESWKGDESRSGGIATNIGVHFYDMLSFVFGKLKRNAVHHRAVDCAGGYLEYERARVKWFLSINGRDMTASEGFAQRCMNVDGVGFFDFSKGFEVLHTISYQEIIAGRGFPLSHVRPSIETVCHIRTGTMEPDIGERHPMLVKVLADNERYVNGWPV